MIGVLELVHNPGTSVIAIPPLSDAKSFEQVFVRHYAELRALSERSGAPGYIVAAAQPGDEAVRTYVMVREPKDMLGGACVLGRHTRCTVQLPDDGHVSLRHVLLRLSPHGERPFLRLLDLNTGQAFMLVGKGLCNSATTDGPAILGIGAYAVLLLPTILAGGVWPEDAAAAWHALWPREQPPAPSVLPAPSLVQLRSAKTESSWECRSHIEEARPPVTPRPLAHDGKVPDDTYATLHFTDSEDASQEAWFALTCTDLENGVLLGRGRRCALGCTGDTNVSRVHVVLIKDGERVFVIDAASTNGILVDGRVTVLCPLAYQSVLALSPRCLVRWRRQPGLAGTAASESSVTK